MRIQHYEYEVDGQTRRMLVLSETADAAPASKVDDDWLQRMGFTGVLATHERVQLGEYFESESDAVDKFLKDVAVPKDEAQARVPITGYSIITADDIANGPLIAAADPELNYPTAQPTITRDQAGKALHDADGDGCVGWGTHIARVREGYIERAVRMLELLGIKVQPDEPGSD